MQEKLAGRVSVSFSCLLLAALCWQANSYYLADLWGYFGFAHVDDIRAFATALVLSGFIGFATPPRISGPGSLVATMLSIVVVVPTVVISLAQPSGLENHGWLIVCLILGHSFVCCVAVATEGGSVTVNGRYLDHLIVGFAFAWVFGTICLIASYWHVMGFASIADTYVQRELGRSTSVWMSYLQTYYTNVICPALFAYGLTQAGKRHFAVLGGVGFLLVYSITAQKYALGTPVVMAGLYLGFKIGAARYTAVLVIALCLLMVLSFWDFSVRGDRSVIAALILHRTIGIPALTLGQYYDVFGQFGYTLWGQVRGISLLSPPPFELTSHPMWPNLGYIVGDLALSMPENNVNANLYASDGAGSFGSLGVLMIAATLSCWLAAINLASRGFHQDIAILFMFPVALTLTNGPFFTVMLSFGGLFWLAAFATIKLWDLFLTNQRLTVPRPSAPEAVTARKN